MIEVVTEAKIPAAAAKIWGVLTDFDRYPEWHPWLTIRGAAAPGASITCSLDTWGQGRALRADGEITEYQEQAALSWVLGVRGVFVMEERFAIEKIGTGANLRHSVKCHGLAALLLGWAMKQKLEHPFKKLKQRIGRAPRSAAAEITISRSVRREKAQKKRQGPEKSARVTDASERSSA